MNDERIASDTDVSTSQGSYRYKLTKATDCRNLLVYFLVYCAMTSFI